MSLEGLKVNKAQLIEALGERIGDKKAASAAVDGLVDIIIRTVHKGEKVNVTGFGVFEKRARAARTARNPRTGETVKVKKTNVPAFRPGTTFAGVVRGLTKPTKASLGQRQSRATKATAAAKPAAAKATTKRAAAPKKATAAAAKTTRRAATTAKATRGRKAAK